VTSPTLFMPSICQWTAARWRFAINRRGRLRI
jgi:hypothetical protein